MHIGEQIFINCRKGDRIIKENLDNWIVTKYSFKIFANNRFSKISTWCTTALRVQAAATTRTATTASTGFVPWMHCWFLQHWAYIKLRNLDEKKLPLCYRFHFFLWYWWLRFFWWKPNEKQIKYDLVYLIRSIKVQ